jgi:hypothetical protein
MDLGLDVELSSFLGTTDNLTPYLYREVDYPPFCFPVQIGQKRSVPSNSTLGGTVASNSPTPVVVAGSSAVGSTAAPTATSTNSGAVNCSGVEPTLGGLPCPDGNLLTCTDSYRWSCPNGDYGIVPLGTFCAW